MQKIQQMLAETGIPPLDFLRAAVIHFEDKPDDWNKDKTVEDLLVLYMEAIS